MKSRIEIIYKGVKIEYKSFTFSGGERQVRLPDFIRPRGGKIEITAGIYDSDGIMELLLVSDAIDNMIDHHVKPLVFKHLNLAYLPYARQDRVCHYGEAFSLRVFMKVLETAKFDSIRCLDIHNPNAFDRITLKNNPPENFELYNYADNFIGKYDYVVCPDHGAHNRVGDVNAILKLPMIIGEKKRSTDTGEILGISLSTTDNRYFLPQPLTSLGSVNVLIIDDICDGGRTFIELAKELKKYMTGEIDLFVAHGIFSKGLEVFDGLIDNVYTAHLFPNEHDVSRVQVIR